MIFARSLLALALSFVATQAAHLSKVNYKGVLSPLLEVPSVTTSYGTGHFEVTAKFATKINYEITVFGLTSPITGAHFHKGARGENGDVLFSLISETIDDTSAVIKGELDIEDLDTYQLFLDGMIYINIHTEDVPSGEVRGQVDTVDLKVYENKMAGPGTKANGVSKVMVDEELTVGFYIDVDKTESSLKAMHFHEGEPFANGPVFFSIDISEVMNKKQGIVTGSFIATDDQYALITDEMAYINVHTLKFPDGEMRSHISKEKYIKNLRG